jgi:hypothetical protein
MTYLATVAALRVLAFTRWATPTVWRMDESMSPTQKIGRNQVGLIRERNLCREARIIRSRNRCMDAAKNMGARKMDTT